MILMIQTTITPNENYNIKLSMIGAAKEEETFKK